MTFARFYTCIFQQWYYANLVVTRTVPSSLTLNNGFIVWALMPQTPKGALKSLSSFLPFQGPFRGLGRYGREAEKQ